jgi:DNA-binding transcriptional ArsR family regulator
VISENLAAKGKHVAELLSLMGSEKRLLILIHLADGCELSVGDLAKRVGLSQPGLSQHLHMLMRLKLVTPRRQRQNIFYSCKSEAAREILRLLDNLTAAGNLPSSRFEDHAGEMARQAKAA